MGSSGSALRVCADHRGGINWLSLSPDGQRLLTGSEDGTARLWSTVDGQCYALLQGRRVCVLATLPASSSSPALHQGPHSSGLRSPLLEE